MAAVAVVPVIYGCGPSRDPQYGQASSKVVRFPLSCLVTAVWGKGFLICLYRVFGTPAVSLTVKFLREDFTCADIHLNQNRDELTSAVPDEFN